MWDKWIIIKKERKYVHNNSCDNNIELNCNDNYNNVREAGVSNNRKRKKE